MITIRLYDLEYTEFEKLRDEIFEDHTSNTGIVSANWSKKLKMAVFAFINESYIPASWHTTKHHHPVEPHKHDLDKKS